MRRKDKSISLYGLKPEMRIVLKVIDGIWDLHKQEAVITAGTEAFDKNGRLIHSSGSLHPFGYALDFRTNYFMAHQINTIEKQLRVKLPKPYQIVVHKTHIHIEYDK